MPSKIVRHKQWCDSQSQWTAHQESVYFFGIKQEGQEEESFTWSKQGYSTGTKIVQRKPTSSVEQIKQKTECNHGASYAEKHQIVRFNVSTSAMEKHHRTPRSWGGWNHIRVEACALDWVFEPDDRSEHTEPNRYWPEGQGSSGTHIFFSHKTTV